MKKNQFVKILLIFTIVIYICLAMRYCTFAGTLSSDINGINENKYPGVKSLIQNLKNTHGNYNFQVYYTGIDWTEAITMEYQGHGKSPKNLFSLSDKYKGKWYCPICGSTKYDTGWYCASIDAIKYMMDPRNSLDETSVYQFKNLEISDVSAENIQQVINSKYASYGYINNPTAINAIVKASSQCHLNGYSIVAKIINEQGSGSSPLIAGMGHQGQYVGVYNFFNVGAYGSGRDNVILNGLRYAQKKGWNSVESSIVGGSEYYKSQYIGKGQNTLYYQRFNVVYQASLFSHQYQQDIMGAQTSATLLKNYYTTSGTISSTNHTFIIPLYENMPKTKCARPSTSENSKLEYEEATVTTNKLAVKAAPNSSRVISYLNKNEKIRVLTKATQKSSDGNYWDIIVSNTDGTYGYVPRSGIQIKSKFPSYMFDYKFYADTNDDLKAAFGYNENSLYEHFINNGIQEGRSASPVFNVKYYLDQYSDLKNVFKTNYQAAYEHFINNGLQEGRSGSPVFNAKYYMDNNADLKVAFKTDYTAACNHFISCGIKEGRKSSPGYEVNFYRNYYEDLRNMSNRDLLLHYIRNGIKEGRVAKLDDSVEKIVFNATVYAECNADLKAAFGNNEQKLKEHWLANGIREGRIASLTYSPEVYRAVNNDLEKAFGNNNKALFDHFITSGIKEPRTSSLIFDLVRYLEANADIKNVYKSNFKEVYIHFLDCGLREGRQASHVFHMRTYLNTYTDLKNAFGNNYTAAGIHFLNNGLKEGRKTSTNFDVKRYAANYADLKNAFGNNFKQYYLHYLTNGRREGRKGI